MPQVPRNRDRGFPEMIKIDLHVVCYMYTCILPISYVHPTSICNNILVHTWNNSKSYYIIFYNF